MRPSERSLRTIRWRTRRFLRQVSRSWDERARTPVYQDAFRAGFPDEGGTDGAEFWKEPRLQATAPLLTVPCYEMGEDLLEGELALLSSYRAELLKGIAGDDDEDEQR